MSWWTLSPHLATIHYLSSHSCCCDVSTSSPSNIWHCVSVIHMKLLCLPLSSSHDLYVIQFLLVFVILVKLQKVIGCLSLVLLHNVYLHLNLLSLMYGVHQFPLLMDIVIMCYFWMNFLGFLGYIQWFTNLNQFPKFYYLKQWLKNNSPNLLKFFAQMVEVSMLALPFKISCLKLTSFINSVVLTPLNKMA